MFIKMETKTASKLSEKEFEKLIDAYQGALVNHAYFITGSIQDAEDIVQECFVKFYFQPPALLEASKAKTYLYRMVHNAGIDIIRKRKQSRHVDIAKMDNLSESQTNGSAEKLLLHNEFLRINLLLEQIPAEQSDVIKMRTISDLSFVEIAGILEIPVATVKSRFTYGLSKLRQLTGIKKEVYDEL